MDVIPRHFPTSKLSVAVCRTSVYPLPSRSTGPLKCPVGEFIETGKGNCGFSTGVNGMVHR